MENQQIDVSNSLYQHYGLGHKLTHQMLLSMKVL